MSSRVTRRSLQPSSQSQSQDSLLLHMSTATNNNAPANDPKQPSTCPKVADLWQTVDRELRLNIGNSLKCGICLSTLTEPVRTPCVHAFCKDCIETSLKYCGIKKCPECNTAITKRSLQPFEYLQDLCDAYKSTLRDFGMVPTKYTPNFTTMTQHVSSSQSSQRDEDDLSPQDQMDRLDVATAWQQKALPLLISEQKIQDLQVNENKQVVEANMKACKSFLVPKSQLNSTQEVLEQAREQQWADEAWKQREDEERKERGDGPSQESSIVLTAPEESQGSSNKRVSFSAKPPTNLDSSTKAPKNLVVRTSHGSEDTEVPAEEDIITPKLTNVTFTKATPKVVVPTSKMRDSTLFESSLSPIDVQASQEISPDPPNVVVAKQQPEEPTLDSSQASDTNKADDSKKTKAAGEEENSKTSNTHQSSRRSRRRSKDKPPSNRDDVEEPLSMPTPSPAHEEEEEEEMSHNDNDESEEQFPILEQGTQMTQDDIDTTAKAMREDSFGALHLLPPKRKKAKPRAPELSQSSQVSNEEENGASHKATEDDPKKKKDIEMSQSSQVSHDDHGHENDANNEMANDDANETETAANAAAQLNESIDDDCTVPIQSESPDASIRTRESPPATVEKTTARTKRTSFGTATTTRFGVAQGTLMEETTIPLNQEEAAEQEENDRKPAARPTTTPRSRRRRNSTNQTNGDEEDEGIDNANVLATPATASRSRVWNVGEIVKVQSRTWPGVNKLGGVARISKVWETADGNYSYDVNYILGGKESKVDAIFVMANDDFDEESKPQQRRRRRADVTEVPMCVLQALDQEGFDTTGLAPVKTPHVKRKRPRLAEGALKDSTNSNKVANAKKAPKAVLKDSNNSKATNTKTAKATKKATTTKNKRKADASNTKESKASKKVAKKAKGNPKTDSKSNEAKEKEGTSKAAEAKTKPAVAKKKALNLIASMTLPEIFIKADDHYESIMDDVQRDGELYVVTSSLKESDMSMLREVCSKSLGNIRIRLTDNFSKRVKVCVLPVVESEDNIRPLIRTVKAVRSALAGIPMVSPDWIVQLKNEKKFVTPKTFVRSLPAKAVPGKKGGVAQYAAGVKSKQNLLLKGTAVFLCGNFPDAQRKDMQLVAKEAGATVLKTPQQAIDHLQQSKRVVVLCQNSKIAPAALEKQLRASLTADPQAALVVGPGWLFDSIASVEELPPNSFPPSEGKQRKVLELWKLCCND